MLVTHIQETWRKRSWQCSPEWKAFTYSSSWAIQFFVCLFSQIICSATTTQPSARSLKPNTYNTSTNIGVDSRRNNFVTQLLWSSLQSYIASQYRRELNPLNNKYFRACIPIARRHAHLLSLPSFCPLMLSRVPPHNCTEPRKV